MKNKDLLDQLDGHLASPNIAWLLGAGISFNANIPLMYPLTKRVRRVLDESCSQHLELLRALWEELPDNSHVEHLLSQIGDYAALADRSRSKEVKIGGKAVARASLDALHGEIVNAIANTVRWGYAPARDSQPERVGTRGDGIVEIGEHREFVAACFRTARAGLHDRRGAVRFFTTNYDTLLEDALALSYVSYWDGFEGGAVAFRSYRLGSDEPPLGIPAHVIKLHGSIDWHWSEDDRRIWRVRDGDRYPQLGHRVLIYPQSTKYLAAQRDPFAAQFDLLRRALTVRSDNVLAICGYSFGDEHINQEIELGMERADSKTTLIAFSQETAIETGLKIADCLDKWRKSSWGKRVYVLT